MELRKGTEPNSLKILVDNLELDSHCRMENGVMSSGIILKFGRYNLSDVLCQMIDDYGEDELIKRINALN